MIQCTLGQVSKAQLIEKMMEITEMITEVEQEIETIDTNTEIMT